MKASRALIFLFFFVALLGGGVMGFNYFVDAQCYYNCSSIDLERYSTNNYYRIAQDIKKHPETEVVIVGSSRGGTTSPVWVSQITGQKALNLSAAGAEIFARSVFLEIALQETKLNKIIWYADYFELLGDMGDEKITKSPALYRYIQPDAGVSLGFSDLQTLIDRNTLEASFHALKPGSAPVYNGSDIDFVACAKEDYAGGVDELRLKREIDLLYESYSRRIFPRLQKEESWNLLIQTLKHLESKKIQTVIVVPPYHPQFRKNLQMQQPEVWQRHLDWISKMQKLQGDHIKVVNYFEGFPGEDASPKYWDDGVHFNCRSAMEMTKPLLQGR